MHVLLDFFTRPGEVNRCRQGRVFILDHPDCDLDKFDIKELFDDN